MDWDKETVLRFLELYQMHPCIWDPEHKWHKNRQRVNEAWDTINDDMGEPFTVRDLKKKRESLMSAYRCYKTKIKKSERLGSDPLDVYQPCWFAFPLMDSFLDSVYTCNSTVDEPIIYEDSNIGQNSEAQSTRSKRQQRSTARIILNRSRRNNPSEHIQSKKEWMKHSCMQHYTQQQKDEGDECSIFGVLVAKKLRKLSEVRRDIMMAKIHQLFIDEHESPSSSSEIIVAYTQSPPK